MASKPNPRHLQLIEQLRSMQGCLAEGERDYLDSYWNTLQRNAAEPTTIRHPHQYAGGDALSIACTQLDLPARQQRALVAEWCDVLPTFGQVRTLWFHSRVPQELFDAACRMPALQGLWIKWSGIQRLDALPQLAALRYFHLGSSAAVQSLAPVSAMRALQWLQLSGIAKVPSLEAFAGLTELVGLGYTGGDGKPITVPSFEPLAGLRGLQWLHLGAVRSADGSLRPLGALTALQWLGLANVFDMAQFAWLATRLPDTLCDWLAPYHRAHRSLFPCRTCKANWRVLTSGKGGKLLCPSCDAPALAKAVMAFEDAAASAKLGL
jgi:hypothetical protein